MTDNLTELEDIPGIGPKRAAALREAGFESIADLERASEDDLLAVEDVHTTLARDIKKTVRASANRPASKTTTREHLTPEDWRVTSKQAAFLAKESGLEVERLVDRTAADLTDRVDWRIDPRLLFYHKVCGRVVKRHPTTDELLPVPNATVHVFDTDCNFLGYFPGTSPWGWFYPFGCDTEEIATVETNACGEFCVFIPRWEVDRIRRFRHEHVCLPDIVDPTIRDILEHLDLIPEPRPYPDDFPPESRPQPDPVPPILREPGTYDEIRDFIGEAPTERLLGLTSQQRFGESTREVSELLSRPAQPKAQPPRLPDDIPAQIEETKAEAMPRTAAFESSERDLQALDRTDFIGPFLRCRDVLVPEWVTITDVPDVTFRVTQDVDADGDAETIYDEGFFDVRWDDVDGSEDTNLVLEADPIAVAAPPCDTGLEIPDCENPTIRLIGAMPLASDYHDNAENRGYATRVNKPRPNGADATTPYAGRLNLYGCGFRSVDEAERYRILYRYRPSSTSSWTNAQPLRDIDWYAVRENWPPIHEHIRPVDSEGWYEIPDPSVLADRFQNLLLHWDTRHDTPNDDGLYRLRLELADGSSNPIEDAKSGWVTLRVDNSRPEVSFDSLRWRAADGSTGGSVGRDCPVIRRPLDSDGNPKTIEIDVSYTVKHPHLRNVNLQAIGCGSGDPTRKGPDADFSFWYDDANDTSYSRTDATFRVQGGTQADGRLPAGAYTIELNAWSRAFNPTRATVGVDEKWKIDPNHIGRDRWLQIAITNG